MGGCNFNIDHHIVGWFCKHEVSYLLFVQEEKTTRCYYIFGEAEVKRNIAVTTSSLVLLVAQLEILPKSNGAPLYEIDAECDVK